MKQTKTIYYILWALAGALFFPTLLSLYSYRWDALEYTHAFFILPVSIGIAFWKREELARAFAETKKRFGLGSLSIFVFGALMYVFGKQQDYMVISAFALIPFLYGFIGFIYGRKVQKLLIFPILYLLLLVPPPFALLDRITLPLQYISAFGVEALFRLLGFSIEREGLMYIIEGRQMMVDSACSGFRSLITMLSLGLVYVYVIKSAAIKKTVLLVSILPLAIMGNILRIMIISLVTVYFGGEAAKGFIHPLSGMVVFVFIALGFAGIEAAWTKITGEEKTKEKEKEKFEWFE